MKDFFGFIRWRSLVLVLIAPIAVRAFLLDYCYGEAQLGSLVPVFDYALFTLSFVFVALAAFVLDECKNRKFYLQNRPDKVYIGKLLGEKAANTLAFVLLVLAIVLGYIVGARNGWLHLGTSFFVITIAVYFFSATRKRSPAAWKLLAALFYALLFLLPVLLETFALKANDQLYRILTDAALQPALKLSYVYAGLAFGVSFLISIVRDLRDADDDVEAGTRSFVTEFTDKGAKGMAYFFAFAIIVLTACFQYRYYAASPAMILGGMSALLHLPLLYFIGELRKAQAVQDYDFLLQLSQMLFISCLLALTSAKFILSGGVV